MTFQTLFHEQIEYLSQHGFDLTLVSSPGPALEEVAKSARLKYIPVNMAREPNPKQDLISLYSLTRLFLRQRFDLVHSTTPKAGLLVALAGLLARVPIRVHTYTGQVWLSLHGFTRRLVRRCDWIISHLNTHCYADSLSQRDLLISEGLVPASKLSVIGPGSVGGVNFNRFRPEIHSGKEALITRRELGIADKALVILFVGRVRKDKGVEELVGAFQQLQKNQPNLELILIGPFEQDRDPLPDHTLNQINQNNKIHAVGFSMAPEKYMGAADVFCLPSYREGFGSVVIEAGAMELPTVASNVTGLVDAVVDGETGFLVPPKDIEALSAALAKLLTSPEMRHHMGIKARQRAISEFDSQRINRLVAEEYYKLVTVTS